MNGLRDPQRPDGGTVHMAGNSVNLSPNTACEYLSYDKDSGVIVWKKIPPNRPEKVGDVAGVTTNGYRKIGLLGNRFYAHRLAWLLHYGEWPTEFLDHINGDRSDNRIANLREADSVINSQNQRRSHDGNVSGLLGVSKHRNKWQAHIRTSGRNIYLGTFQTPELAHERYLEEKRKSHEGCTL